MVATATISAEEWATIRPKFEQLYRIQGKSLQVTIAILKREDNFYATERMCKIKIKQWKLQKHNNDNELLHLLRKHTQYLRAGSKKSFRIRKRHVTAYAARKHFERKGITVDDEVLERAPPSPTPSALSIVPADYEQTPSIETSSTISPPSTELDSLIRDASKAESTPDQGSDLALTKSKCSIAKRLDMTNIILQPKISNLFWKVFGNYAAFPHGRFRHIAADTTVR